MKLASRIQFTTVVLILAIACIAAAAQNKSGATATDIPKGYFSIPPEKLKWAMNADGTHREVATLFGDPTKHELYGYLVKWPPNTNAKAHSHPDDRYVMVVSGTFYLGHGNRFDATKLERQTTGTMYSEPRTVAHFGATKDEGAVLYFVGIGPDRTDVIEK
jgi:secreted PhoX family phosphatase